MIGTAKRSRPARGSLPDEIVQRIVELILEEGLRPGDRLPSERDLMARLRVGRSTLREALKTLTVFGVVEIAMGSGMFVAEGDASILTRPLAWGLLMGERSTRDVVEARRVVEIELAGLAAERATDADIAELAEKLALMQIGVDDPAAFARYDVEFHLAIARAAHNQVLYHVIDTLRHVLRAWFAEAYRRVEARVHAAPRAELIRWHGTLFEAIRAHDREAARAAMARHVEGGARWLRDALEETSRGGGAGD